MRRWLHMMDRLAVNRGRFGILELLHVLLGELRPVNFDSEFLVTPNHSFTRAMASAFVLWSSAINCSGPV